MSGKREEVKRRRPGEKKNWKEELKKYQFTDPYCLKYWFNSCSRSLDKERHERKKPVSGERKKEERKKEKEERQEKRREELQRHTGHSPAPLLIQLIEISLVFVQPTLWFKSLKTRIGKLGVIS